MSRNPKNNWCLSRIFVAWFGQKDCCLSKCEPWSKQVRRLDSFLHKTVRTLNSNQIFKIKNKKYKTYSGWCPFQGLSNGTTLMQIQSGRTVPLMWNPFECAIKFTYRLCIHSIFVYIFSHFSLLGEAYESDNTNSIGKRKRSLYMVHSVQFYRLNKKIWNISKIRSISSKTEDVPLMYMTGQGFTEK